MKTKTRKLSLRRETLSRMTLASLAGGALTGTTCASNPNRCFHTAEDTCFGCPPTTLTPNCSIYCTATV